MNNDNWTIISPWNICDLKIGTPIRQGTAAGVYVHIQTEDDFNNLPEQIQEEWGSFEDAEDEEIFVGEPDEVDPASVTEGILVKVGVDKWWIQWNIGGETEKFSTYDDGITQQSDDCLPAEHWQYFLVRQSDLDDLEE